MGVHVDVVTMDTARYFVLAILVLPCPPKVILAVARGAQVNPQSCAGVGTHPLVQTAKGSANMEIPLTGMLVKMYSGANVNQ